MMTPSKVFEMFKLAACPVQKPLDHYILFLSILIVSEYNSLFICWAFK